MTSSTLLTLTPMSATTLLLLQLIVVLVVAKACSGIANRLGQPGVVGEMAAGVVLGPIVLGALAPKAHAAIFSASSLSGLTALSTFWARCCSCSSSDSSCGCGPDVARAQIRAATSVGVASVVAPLLLGWPSRRCLLPEPGAGPRPFAAVRAVLAAALSITTAASRSWRAS